MSEVVETTLGYVAAVLRVHPRTLLRHVTGEVNPYWVPGYEDEVTVDPDRVARALLVSPRVLREALEGRGRLLTTEEMALVLDVPRRTFEYRGYPATIRRPGLVRYHEPQVQRYHHKHWGE